MGVIKKHKSRIRWGIKSKLMSMLTISLSTVVIILTYNHISSQKKVLEYELTKRHQLMKENLIERGKSNIISLTEQIEIDISAFNFSHVIEILNHTVLNSKDIKAAILVNLQHIVIVHTQHPKMIDKELSDDITLDALKLNNVHHIEYVIDSENVIEIQSPIQISQEPWGVLRLVYSLQSLESERILSTQMINDQLKKMIVNTALTSLACMLFTLLFSVILANKLTTPLILLSELAKKLSQKNFQIEECKPVITSSNDEIGVLTDRFFEMSYELKKTYNELAWYNRTLEQKVKERTVALNQKNVELNETLQKIEKINNGLTENIKYAKIIQQSLLPNLTRIKLFLPNSFMIWLPRDIVGGDIYYIDSFMDGIIIAVFDCTGHGVSGAFMTMLASTAIRQIVRNEACYDPSEVLKRLNHIMKTTLQQDKDFVSSDDGLDAAICLYMPNKKKLFFSGAKLPLIYCNESGIQIIKGDKHNIGYKKSDLNFYFTCHEIDLSKRMIFYLCTDGYSDQVGGNKGYIFSNTRLHELISLIQSKPLYYQGEKFLEVHKNYKGSFKQTDDITVIAFAHYDTIEL
ncbi:MAG: SpoIIE family protein phosphatase [Desulfobacterales bacterium]|nr:SpoIIE family protein phosphatase [Desulfobacterales bacterium]